MPKEGMTGVTLKTDVAELLRSRAQTAGLGLNEFIINKLLGPSLPSIQDGPGTVPEPVIQQLITLLQTLNQKLTPTQPQNDESPSFGEAFLGRKGSVGLGGFGPPSRAPEAHRVLPVMSWGTVRGDFVKWIQSKNYDRSYTSRIVSELDKRVEVIANPLDVSVVFSGLTSGQRHNLDRAVRAFFNFHEEILAVDEKDLASFRRAIPADEVGIDVNVPSEAKVVESLRALAGSDPKYWAAYNLALDAGLRITEDVRLINSLDEAKLERLNGFAVYPLSFFRKTKLSYFGFFTDQTLDLIKKVHDQRLTAANVSGYLGKRHIIDCKYLRKFAFDTMIDLGIPESVADFIQGRTPKTVGARHYMVLLRKAKKFYPRYVRYVAKLRQKTLN